MLVRWLPLICAALLLTRCGSSDGTTAARSPTATAAATTPAPTATATPTVQSAALRQLPQVPAPSGPPPSSASAPQSQFLRNVFDDAQAMWRDEFSAANLAYRPARLTIFRHGVHTACGSQSANVGPFYCPASSGVYLDPAFFSALSAKVGVHLGDFAQAYVIAHEVAHHVQAVLGVLQQVAAADQQDPAGANARSVRVELQADCFAGVWAHSAYQRGALTQTDFADALRAAAVVGDDFLSRATTGVARPPESFTHGTSAQRQQWLTTGFQEGRPAACDTFG
jgi:predicted metalloprotease